jgi:uncharacterized protein
LTAAAAASPEPPRLPWRLRGGALALSFRLTPRSARDEIGGVDYLSDRRPVVKARVRVAPQDGEANAVLIRLVAKSLRIAAIAARIESGVSAGLKTLLLDGDAKDLEAALLAPLAERG